VQLLTANVARFRNLIEVALEPGPRATVLVGENGQGKTNTLEALYYATTLRPLRATRLAELVPFGRASEGACVRLDWQFPGGPRRFGVQIVDGERQLELDEKRLHEVTDYVSPLSIVAFTPDDLTLVKGAPDGRRRFLDRAVFGRWPAYLEESRQYTRALRSRNRLLRERAAPALREAFDPQLARLGARLWRRRLSLVDELLPHVQSAFDAVGRLTVPLKVRYRPLAVELAEGDDESRLAERLYGALMERAASDLERGFTSVGPHADDLQLLLGDRPARLYGSQGQQRATVLALKIAEIENLRSHRGSYPLLLLDDVSSELDPERNRHLMDYLRALEAQVVLTTTDAALVRHAVGDDAVRYTVANGRLQRG